MICTRAFQGQPGEMFGLRVANVQNAVFCTADVISDRGEELRFGLQDLMSGQAVWQLASNTTYTIVMQVRSQDPGQEVSVDVEIPIGNGGDTCSRLSSGMIGNWRVDVF